MSSSAEAEMELGKARSFDDKETKDDASSPTTAREDDETSLKTTQLSNGSAIEIRSVFNTGSATKVTAESPSAKVKENEATIGR